MQAVIDASGLPFATMFMGKSVLDEQHPNYIGMYNGALMNEEVRDFVESCDLVLEVGTQLTDFNSGAFTAKLDPARTVVIGHHRTRVDGKVYPNVEMGRHPRRAGAAFVETSPLEEAAGLLARRASRAGDRRHQRGGALSAVGELPSPQ